MMKSISPTSQKRALISIIKAFSAMGFNSFYLRVVLGSESAKHLPSIITQVFIQQSQLIPPGQRPTARLASVAQLLKSILVWGSPDDGDDQKACMNSSIRQELKTSLGPLILADNALEGLSEVERDCQDRLYILLAILQDIDRHPLEAQVILSLRQRYRGQYGDLGLCWSPKCEATGPTQRCSRCHVVLFCNSKCRGMLFDVNH